MGFPFLIGIWRRVTGLGIYSPVVYFLQTVAAAEMGPHGSLGQGRRITAVITMMAAHSSLIKPITPFPYLLSKNALYAFHVS